MSNKENNMPAFPVIAGQNVYSNGMSLRDWFAGQALAPMMADMPLLSKAAREDSISPTKYAAKCAYEIADAMMEARK